MAADRRQADQEIHAVLRVWVQGYASSKEEGFLEEAWRSLQDDQEFAR